LNAEAPVEVAAKQPWRCLGLICCLLFLVVILVTAIGVLLVRQRFLGVMETRWHSGRDSSQSLSHNASMAPTTAAIAADAAAPMTSAGRYAPITSPIIDAVANVKLDLVGATAPLPVDSLAVLSKGCHQFLFKKFDFSGSDVVECQLVSQGLVERERPYRQRCLLQSTVTTTTSVMVTALRIQLHITIQCSASDSYSDSYSDSFTEAKLLDMLQYATNAKSLLTFWTKSGDTALAAIQVVVLSDNPLALLAASSTASTMSPALS
jgi:hypothetical protein